MWRVVWWLKLYSTYIASGRPRVQSQYNGEFGLGIELNGRALV
jgi:hypothetical protein